MGLRIYIEDELGYVGVVVSGGYSMRLVVLPINGDCDRVGTCRVGVVVRL